MTVHPNYIEAEEDLEDSSMPEGHIILNDNVFVKKVRQDRKSLEEEDSVDLDENVVNLFEHVPDLGVDPRFSLDIFNMRVVKFVSDLMQNLDLKVTYQSVFGNAKIQEFDNSISYDVESRKAFRKCIYKRKGYLVDNSNYFNVAEDKLTKGTKVTTLRNSRVILFYRGLSLTDLTVKRILTAGLLFLIKEMTYAELLMYVKQLIPTGSYEVTINHKSNTYVLIGIEESLFSF